MDKKLVKLESKTLEMRSRGEGEPVIVIETGMGSSMDEWNYIFKEISKLTTVLMYHRSGYGRSTVDFKENRTISTITSDLHALLNKIGIFKNIILVGHSFGGLCIQNYAKEYPNNIRGLVMIDASPNDYNKLEELKKQLKVINEKYNTKRMINRWSEFSKKTKDDICEEIRFQFNKNGSEDLGEEQKNRLDFLTNPIMYKSMVSEFNNMIDFSADDNDCTQLCNISIKILIRDKRIEIAKLINNGIPIEEAERLENLIQKLVRKQVTLSDKSEIIEAKDCGHNV